MKHPFRSLAWALALLCALLLAGGGVIGGGSSEGAADAEEQDGGLSAGSGAVEPEDMEMPAGSSAVTPENRTEAYALLLEGLWEEDGGASSYLFYRDGTGSVYWTEQEELLAFEWNVLSEEAGRDLLYLFFEGAEAAVCYLPVFDEGTLTLCDPEDGGALVLLLEGTALG